MDLKSDISAAESFVISKWHSFFGGVLIGFCAGLVIHVLV